MIFQRITAVLFVLALSACGGGGAGGGGGGSTPISVITVSGVQTSLDGTYTTFCRTKSGVDVVEGLIISGGNWAYTRYSYTTIDGSCGAGETLASSVLAALSATGTTGAIAGWTESGNPAAAPPASGGGLLNDTESYTQLSLTAATVTVAGTYTLGAMGDTVDFYYIVDDTGANDILYIPDFDAVNPMVSATSSGSFTRI